MASPIPKRGCRMKSVPMMSTAPSSVIPSPRQNAEERLCLRINQVPSATQSGAVLPGVIGTIQATETIKLIVGAGNPLIGRLLLFDALAMRLREVKLRKDPDCPVCGGPVAGTRRLGRAPSRLSESRTMNGSLRCTANHAGRYTPSTERR